MDHGHKSLVKRQHSTRRRCVGLEGARRLKLKPERHTTHKSEVTTASSVPLKHEPRVEGGAAAKRRESWVQCALLLRAGGVGTPPPQQQSSAAGGVRTSPPSSRRV